MHAIDLCNCIKIILPSRNLMMPALNLNTLCISTPVGCSCVSLQDKAAELRCVFLSLFFLFFCELLILYVVAHFFYFSFFSCLDNCCVYCDQCYFAGRYSIVC